MTQDQQRTVLTVAIIAAALYILYKLKSAFSPPEGTITGGTAQSQPVNEANTTWSAGELASYADEIEALVWSGLGFSEDDEQIGQILSLMNTKDDVQALINTYGTRGKGYIIQEYYNLPQTISKYLDTDVKDRVNQIYRNKKISYTWN